MSRGSRCAAVLKAMMPPVLLAAGAAFAEPSAQPHLSIRLSDAEREALDHSPVLKAAESDLAAAEAQVAAQLAPLLPRVTLDGSYQYQTQVPKVSLAPNAPPFQFGSHDVYSIGPTVSYTLWDQGALLNAYRSQKALANSQQAQRELVRRQVRLMVRLDYFQVQLALEAERSLADSLHLAEAQYRDIDNRYRAGAASRIDWLSAHEQTIVRRRDFRAAQADVAAALRTLFARTGRGQDADLSAPVDARIREPAPAVSVEPTVRIELEPLESVEAALESASSAPVDEAHPQLLTYERQAESQRLASRSISAGRWPRVQFSFKSDYLYPNLPLLERTWQNMAAATASVPLFEFGRTKRQAEAQKDAADSSERRRDEARDELLRDWRTARDRYAALRYQEELDRESVSETEEIARLRYASYRNGGSTILDVETANVNAVEARVAAARRRTQVLVELATLDSLSAVKVKP